MSVIIVASWDISAKGSTPVSVMSLSVFTVFTVSADSAKSSKSTSLSSETRPTCKTNRENFYCCHKADLKMKSTM
jgi:hypothetical protein